MYIKIARFFFILYLSLISFSSYALLPQAQIISGGNGKSYKLKDTGTIEYSIHDSYLLDAAKWLKNSINKQDNYRWDIKDNFNATSKSSGTVISLYGLKNDRRIPYKKADKRYNESYIIEVDKKITIYAGGPAGALYGVQRLFDMLSNHSLVQGSTIIDYPDYKWRTAYINLGNIPCGEIYWLKPNEKEKWLSCMRTLIDSWSLLHINGVFIQSPVFYRLNNNDMQLLGTLFSYARKKNIEPAPVLASKLWGIPLDQINTNAIEGIYHKNAKFIVSDGRLIPLYNHNKDNDLKWDIKHYLFNNNWRKEDSDKNIKEGVSIKQQINNNPWKNPVYLKDMTRNIKLKIKPGQYYELMLSIKSKKRHDMRLFITPIELDKDGRELKGLHRNTTKLFTTRYWRKRWIPIFTSQNTYALTLHISAKNISNKVALAEVSDPILIPMKNKLINVLVNSETSPIVTSNDGKRTYISGKDFEIDKGTIKEWRETGLKNIKKTIIKVLPGSKIHNGQTVNVSFNTLPLEYRAIPASKYSPVSHYTIDIYQRVFNRLKRLKPKYIHISLDEHKGGLNRDSRSKKFGLCNRDLYISYINTLDDLLHKSSSVNLPLGTTIKGAGLVNTKLVVWDDMLNPWHNGSNSTYQSPYGGVAGSTGLKNQTGCNNIKLDHNIILADWWYKGSDKRSVIKNSPSFYRKLGYQYFISPWYQRDGIKSWVESVKPKDTKGFIATTWSKNLQGIDDMACVAWNRSAYKNCLLENNE